MSLFIEMFKGGIGYGVLTLEVAKVHVENGSLIIAKWGSHFREPHCFGLVSSAPNARLLLCPYQGY